ncbi:MAG: cobyric acid synthase [Gloeobacterales cyanobacterium]
MSAAKSLLVVATSSHAGKSLICTALCRIFKCRGYRVTPFKGQNMALNAYVGIDGGEIGYAQAVQAWAAGVEPSAWINPILLKPLGNMTSQVVIKGQAVATVSAQDYYKKYFDPGWQAVVEALDYLQSQYDVIVMEGAGSPAEVNLKHRDLTNMRLATHLNCPAILVADIDRGGALAHVVGTLQLLDPEERAMVKGLVINKFRGSLDLLQPGLDWLEEYTGIPVVGVIPWFESALPAEDSVSLLDTRVSKRQAELEIAVIRYPRISNFTDFDALEAESSVRVRYVPMQGALGSPDAVILPGSKATISDLEALKTSGLARQLQDFARAGGTVLGICGGWQMLGQKIQDIEGLEGMPGIFEGLNVIPMDTVFEEKKITRQVQTETLEGDPIEGYEIHQGRSSLRASAESLFVDPTLGAKVGNITGTYLHGLLDNHAWRRTWLNSMRSRKNLLPFPPLSGHYRAERDALFDDLAVLVETHLDIPQVESWWI